MKVAASLAIGVACVVGAAAFAAEDMVSEDALYTLSSIDSVPSRSQIDFAFDGPSNALPALARLASSEGEDTGIRLRAVYALGKYCGDQTTPCAPTDLAHESVLEVIDTVANAQTPTGIDILLLRASIETLGVMRVSTDVTTLTNLLGHPSRDIRASTARALQDLCNTQAIPPLRLQYAHEPTEQVKLAISEALRILAQCSDSQ